MKRRRIKSSVIMVNETVSESLSRVCVPEDIKAFMTCYDL